VLNVFPTSKHVSLLLENNRLTSTIPIFPSVVFPYWSTKAFISGVKSYKVTVRESLL